MSCFLLAFARPPDCDRIWPYRRVRADRACVQPWSPAPDDVRSRGVKRTSRLRAPTSESDRCCRKSRKSNDAKNLANVDFWTTPPLRCSLVSIRRSVVVFLRSDVVPHVAAYETHQQL